MISIRIESMNVDWIPSENPDGYFESALHGYFRNNFETDSDLFGRNRNFSNFPGKLLGNSGKELPVPLLYIS